MSDRSPGIAFFSIALSPSYCARLTVSDTGIGIPEDSLERVFERFYRVDKSRSKEVGGTGLGLSIVKGILRIHNAAYGVESGEGCGSVFWFELPLAKTEKNEED